MNNVCRMVRLGGLYERARLANEWDEATKLEYEYRALSRQMDENYSWWLLLLRGRNCIRKCRNMEELVIW